MVEKTSVFNSVLIDTSSLIKLGLFDVRGFYTNRRASSPLSNEVIEALILYDQVLIDGPSYHRNESRLQQMKRIEEFVSIVDLSTREERHIYLRFEKALGHIREDPKNFDLFRMHTKRWMTTEIGISYPYPSASWHDVEELLVLQPYF